MQAAGMDGSSLANHGRIEPIAFPCEIRKSRCWCQIEQCCANPHLNGTIDEQNALHTASCDGDPSIRCQSRLANAPPLLLTNETTRPGLWNADWFPP